MLRSADEYRRESVQCRLRGWQIRALVCEKYGRWLWRRRKAFKDVNVVYANGTVKDYKWFKPFYRYPKVKPGSMVVVGAKPVKEEKEKQKKQQSDFDWQEFSGNFMAQITSLINGGSFGDAIAVK